MKKVMFALAIAGMFSFAACNGAEKNEEVVDSAAMVAEATEAPAEETMDSAAEVVEAAAEETVEAAQ